MIEFENFTEVEVDTSLLEEVLNRVLKKESSGEEWNLSIVFVGEEEMRELNQSYRGKDEDTDVLSFDLSLKEVGHRRLGQIVICPSQVSEGRMELTTVHGVLHLLGYDHQTEDDLKKMRSKEKEYVDDI